MIWCHIFKLEQKLLRIITTNRCYPVIAWKIETVNWYIELLRAGSEKYIVPHSLSEFESIKSQLNNSHEQIMRVK